MRAAQHRPRVDHPLAIFDMFYAGTAADTVRFDAPPPLPAPRHAARRGRPGLVTRASGRSHRVRFRYAANTRLREAVMWWSYNSLKTSPWAADAYQHARNRG